MGRRHASRRSDAGRKGTGVINTAYIERLNATFRERLAALTRRGRALARRTLTLQHGMYLIGTVYNFCTPHASLAHAGRGTTPAMAAGITDHCWTVQELLSFHVPPRRWTPPKQRGRPSHALKRLIARGAETTVSCGATTGFEDPCIPSPYPIENDSNFVVKFLSRYLNLESDENGSRFRSP